MKDGKESREKAQQDSPTQQFFTALLLGQLVARKPFCRDTHPAYYLVMLDKRLPVSSGIQGSESTVRSSSVTMMLCVLFYFVFTTKGKSAAFSNPSSMSWSQKTGALWAGLLPQRLSRMLLAAAVFSQLGGVGLLWKKNGGDDVSSCEVGTHKCGRHNLSKI